VQAQSITTSESFDATTFPPTGWSIKQPTLVNPIWVRRTIGQNGTFTVCQTHSGAGLARYTSRSTSSAGYTQNLVSKVVDYTLRNSQATDISFWMYRDSIKNYFEDSLTVFISTVDSFDASAVRLGAVARHRNINLPDTQATSGWYQYTFSVPTTYNTATNYFIFQGTSQTDTNGQGANVFIDDVSYLEFPPLCTGIPNVGTIVTPTTLLCDSGGTANYSLTAPITNLVGLSYTWQYSPTGAAPWTDFGTAITATQNLTSSVYVQCLVNCSYSGLSYTTPIVNMVVTNDSTPTVTLQSTPPVACIGDTVFMRANGSDNYTWSPAVTSLSSNNDTVAIIATTSTTYSVTGTNLSGCSDNAVITVQVSVPTITMTALPNDTICAGDSVVLNCVQFGGTNTYLWSNGVTTRRDTVAPTANTTYSVIVTNAAGCTNTGSINITVNPAVVANFSGTMNSASLSTTNTSTGDIDAYYWQFGDGSTDSTASPSHTFTAPGSYTVTLTVFGPCGSSTDSLVVVVYPDGIANAALNMSQLYPNPAQDVLHVNATANMNSIEIFNTLGKSVHVQKLEANKLNTIKVSQLSAGTYIIRIGNQFGRISKL
jgi:PKD repeat protein